MTENYFLRVDFQGVIKNDPFSGHVFEGFGGKFRQNFKYANISNFFIRKKTTKHYEQNDEAF